MKRLHLALLITTLSCSSCQRQSRGDLDGRINALNERVKKLEDSAQWDQLMQDSEGVAFLRTSETSYAMLKADFGSVAASVENVSDYADGSKIVIRLGNTTSASANGLKAKIDWGEVDYGGAVKGPERTKQEQFADILPAASWHDYSIILPGTPPNRVGFIRISSLQSSSISLVTR